MLPPAATLPQAVYPDAARLFLATGTPFAAAGDNVSVDLFSYLGVTLTNPDAPPVVDVTGSSTLSVRGFDWVGTGHYRGYVLLPRDAPSGTVNVASVVITARAAVGGTSVTGSTGISWITNGLYLRFLTSSNVISYGLTIHLRAELYNGSEPVDADPASVWFYPLVAFNPPPAGFVPNRTGVGIYEANYTVPSDAIGLGANATYRGIRVSRSLWLFPPSLYPDLTLASYQVWYHTISSNASELRGDLWVADPSGNPAPDVPVNLEVGMFANAVSVSGVTDSAGRFALNISLAAPTAVVGTVGGSSPLAVKVQADFLTPYGFPRNNCGISTTEIVPVDPSILPDGSLRDFLVPGARVTRSFLAVNPSVSSVTPLSNRTLTYYVIGGSTGSVEDAGHALTDAHGSFSIPFTVPAEEFSISFNVSGTAYPASLAYCVASPLLGLQLTPLRLGGPTQVVSEIGGPGALYAESGSVFGEVQVRGFEPDGGLWDEWDLSSRVVPGMAYLGASDGGLNTTLHLPSFLPAGARYIVETEAASDFPSAVGVPLADQFALVTPGQAVAIPIVGPSPGPPASLSIWVWIALGAAIAAVGVIGTAIILSRRRRQMPPPSLKTL